MQLSRKLGKSQQEIVDFLSDQGIEIKLHGNSKIPDDTLPSLYQHFEYQDAPSTPELAPENVEPTAVAEEEPESTETITTIADVIVEEEKEEEAPMVELELEVSESTSVEAEVTVPPLPESEDLLTSNEIDDPEIEAEKPNVKIIRAKKVKLEGIKVLGKIELPEPVIKEKKNEENEKNESSRDSKKRPNHNRNRNSRRGKRSETYEQKQKKLAREEARKKRQKERKEKAKKKKHYEEKLQLNNNSASKKKVKKKKQTHKPKREVIKHKNPIKRFWAWLNGVYD